MAAAVTTGPAAAAPIAGARTAEVSPRAIAVGAQAMAVVLEPAQCDQLARFAALLLKWNAVHNLTALASPDEVLTLHLLDALSLVPYVRSATARVPLRVLDVGSGGGLPGLVVAIALPDVQVTLIDKVGKKTAFLEQARLELRLANLAVVHGRAQAWHSPMQFDVITARALATLSDLAGWTSHLLAPEGRWLAMKGLLPAAELAELAPQVAVDAIVPLVVPGLAAERHLIVMSKAR